MALILVIDDDGVARDAFRAFLPRKGHEVLAAEDGKEGVRLFRERAPDLVILDRNLPELSGSGVFAAIRELSAEVPILIVSGYDAPEDADKYMAMGAAAFLSKGDGLSPVLAAVDRILAGKTAPAVPAGPGPGRPKRAAGGGRSAWRVRPRDVFFAILGLALASAAFYVFVPWRGTPGAAGEARLPSVPPVPAAPPASGPGSSKEEMLRRALLKYGDRPVVKELLEDLEKNPEAARVLAEADPREPLKALKALRAVPGGAGWRPNTWPGRILFRWC